MDDYGDDDWGTVKRKGREAGMKAVMRLRTAVSADKNRLKDSEFDLDLTYITDKIIAMAFPAENLMEQAYRNDIDDVSAYLQRRHGDHFYVFNLSAEKHYDPYWFNKHVANMGWPDHHSPTLSHLFKVCEAMDEWLKKHPENVAVVHCKAGKGRTGTAIAAYFIYSGFCKNAKDALRLFAEQRSSKMKGVTVPSQIRYVEYLDDIVSGRHTTDMFENPVQLVLTEMLIEPVPDVDKLKKDGGIRPIIEFAYGDDPHNSFNERKLDRSYRAEAGDSEIRIPCGMINMCGDIYVKVYHQHVLLGKTKRNLVFRFAFHTSYVENNVLKIDVEHLDSPSHGKLNTKNYPHEMMITLYFEGGSGTPAKASRTRQRKQTYEPVSEAVFDQASDTAAGSYYSSLSPRKPIEQQHEAQTGGILACSAPPNSRHSTPQPLTYYHQGATSHPPSRGNKYHSAPRERESYSTNYNSSNNNNYLDNNSDNDSYNSDSNAAPMPLSAPASMYPSPVLPPRQAFTPPVQHHSHALPSLPLRPHNNSTAVPAVPQRLHSPHNTPPTIHTTQTTTYTTTQTSTPTSTPPAHSLPARNHSPPHYATLRLNKALPPIPSDTPTHTPTHTPILTPTLTPIHTPPLTPTLTTYHQHHPQPVPLEGGVGSGDYHTTTTAPTNAFTNNIGAYPSPPVSLGGGGVSGGQVFFVPSTAPPLLSFSPLTPPHSLNPPIQYHQQPLQVQPLHPLQPQPLQPLPPLHHAHAHPQPPLPMSFPSPQPQPQPHHTQPVYNGSLLESPVPNNHVHQPLVPHRT
eukprot:TRINITY_DN8358_c0_g1_i2.p1 TRINITY_DN8358_c0_g1~~TRINITY_DN8358_c0_g1_i2.p1  ORF type:complete len:793 (-),score=157.75 TRINITY_DN8358_c0_g1_i2:88-2466(-)